MRRLAVDNLSLERWRRIAAEDVLAKLAEHRKADPTYCPRTSSGTTRWHANLAGKDVEVLCTGVRFFDVRANHGGGGAVDFAMHFFDLNFSNAVALLREKGV